MSLVLRSRQSISDGDEYFIPCPLCSFLGHSELGGDIIRGPGALAGRSGRVVAVYCCRFSEILFRLNGCPQKEIAANWRELLRRALQAEAERPGKITTTMTRLAEKGYLPTTFPFPNPVDI